ncbi:MAG: PepSY domain-containing protein [Pseudomonadota bacterium]|nr:PepSY domain-containing protein [Pseudomonadota bacterium]
MFRTIHRWPGLLALAFITVLALSGAVLSVFPAAESLSAPKDVSGQSVAELTSRIQAQIPGVEQIKRAPSGEITAYWFDGDVFGSAVIDPSTGAAVASADPNAVERWLTTLHRSLFLGDTGRIAMALAAAAMLVLAASGIALVLRRVGGWRNWFAPLRGPLSGRLHTEIARVAMVGLIVSATTALWMTASTFDLLPDGEPVPAYPTEVTGLTGTDFADMPLLVDTPVTDLRELNFPFPGDATDTYQITTRHGAGMIDQGSGALLSWVDATTWQRVSETIYMLHTGQGAWLVGIVLGLLALGVPILGVTGVVLWAARRRSRPRIAGNQSEAQADTIILVGSESGSTWGFARTLKEGLSAAGHSVHVGAMSGFAPERYLKAERLLVLVATYGDGAAPSNATGFLDKLHGQESEIRIPVAVLGFGERAFPDYCAFGQQVHDQFRALRWEILLPFDTVDGKSPQDFARWGHALGDRLGVPLSLVHTPALPRQEHLTLVSRRDYGAEVQAPTAILRFKAPRPGLIARLTGAGFSRYKAGDLIGIVPVGSDLPRYYSLASSARDGFVEIVVRKQPGGLASGQLMALEPGDTVQAFLRRNTAFKPGRGKQPLILIGAGTGIGPLAGFIRDNRSRRPIHLFFGLRDPGSDFLYDDDLAAWSADGKVSALHTAVSRSHTPEYVQGAVLREADTLVSLIRDGARVMVCGGRDMAAGVADAFADILTPSGLSPQTLKAEGRYLEDVY